MSIMFNTVLAEAGLDLETVILMRHQDRRADNPALQGDDQLGSSRKVCPAYYRRPMWIALRDGNEFDREPSSAGNWRPTAPEGLAHPSGECGE